MARDKDLAIRRGNNIRAALSARGMKQVTLAKKLGIEPTYLNQLVTGHRMLSRYNASRISEILEVRTEYLLDVDPYMTDEDAEAARLQRIEQEREQAKEALFQEFCQVFGYQGFRGEAYLDFRGEAYRFFLAVLARRVGASIQYEPAEQDLDSVLTVEDYQPGCYSFTSASGSGTIPEAEMARATDEVLEFAAFKLQRLINQNIDAEASGAAGENSERPAVMVQFAGPKPAAQRLRQLKESDLPVDLKDTLEQIILKQQEEANSSGTGETRTARKEEE